MQAASKVQTVKEEASKKLETLFEEPPKGTKLDDKLDELDDKIEALKKQRDFLLSKERGAVIEMINSKIEKYGITARDLAFGHAVFKQGNKAKVAPKYKLGELSWTGRGRQPKWVADHISKGGKLEDLLIK